MTRAVPDLLLWCAEHGIEIDKRLEIRVSSVDGSMSIFTKPDASVAIGETLVHIPKSMVFSAKNCSRSRDIPTRSYDDPSLVLSLAFLLETYVGPDSRWYGYFSSLPKDIVDIAVFWGTNDDPDSIEANEWLKGTEAGKILFPPGGLKLLDRVNAYFETTVKGVLRQLKLPSSAEGFRRAYSIVSSRAFLVDAYHELSLVPIADAFDHVEDNHVHLESDYHVCPICGSLDECDHDAETPASATATAYSGVDTCEMVANIPIGPDQEVFNTYEKGLTNAQLLCQYGFTLDVNENNLISWSIDELLHGTAEPGRTLELWTQLETEWPSPSGWGDLQLVFNPRYRDEADEDGVPKRMRPSCFLLDLNADGQISHQLWLLLFALALPDVDVGTNDAILVARQVARAQEQLEACLTSEVTTFDPGPPSTVEGRGPLDLLRKIAESVVQICEVKIGSAHCAGMSEAQIGDMLDELPAHRRLTRRAIAYALEERKLLHACHTAWSEVAGLCRVACQWSVS